MDAPSITPLVDDDRADWSRIETPEQFAAAIEHYKAENRNLLRAASVQMAMTWGFPELSTEQITNCAIAIYLAGIEAADRAVDEHAALIERHLLHASQH